MVEKYLKSINGSLRYYDFQVDASAFSAVNRIGEITTEIWDVGNKPDPLTVYQV